MSSITRTCWAVVSEYVCDENKVMNKEGHPFMFVNPIGSTTATGGEPCAVGLGHQLLGSRKR